MAKGIKFTKKKILLIILVLLVLAVGAFYYPYINRSNFGPVQVDPPEINTIWVTLKPGAKIETVLSDFGLPPSSVIEKSSDDTYYLSVPKNEFAFGFAEKISTNSAVQEAQMRVPNVLH